MENGPIVSERRPRISKAKREGLCRMLRRAALKITEDELETHGEFTTADLIGKTIADHIRVGYPDIHHPEEQSPNPGSLDVTVYSDMTVQISRSIGDGGNAHVRRYLFDGKRWFYTDAID